MNNAKMCQLCKQNFEKNQNTINKTHSNDGYLCGIFRYIANLLGPHDNDRLRTTDPAAMKCCNTKKQILTTCDNVVIRGSEKSSEKLKPKILPDCLVSPNVQDMTLKTDIENAKQAYELTKEDFESIEIISNRISIIILELIEELANQNVKSEWPSKIFDEKPINTPRCLACYSITSKTSPTQCIKAKRLGGCSSTHKSPPIDNNCKPPPVELLKPEIVPNKETILKTIPKEKPITKIQGPPFKQSSSCFSKIIYKKPSSKVIPIRKFNNKRN